MTFKSEELLAAQYIRCNISKNANNISQFVVSSFEVYNSTNLAVPPSLASSSATFGETGDVTATVNALNGYEVSKVSADDLLDGANIIADAAGGGTQTVTFKEAYLQTLSGTNAFKLVCAKEDAADVPLTFTITAPSTKLKITSPASAAAVYDQVPLTVDVELNDYALDHIYLGADDATGLVDSSGYTMTGSVASITFKMGFWETLAEGIYSTLITH